MISTIKFFHIFYALGYLSSFLFYLSNLFSILLGEVDTLSEDIFLLSKSLPELDEPESYLFLS